MHIPISISSNNNTHQIRYHCHVTVKHHSKINKINWNGKTISFIYKSSLFKRQRQFIFKKNNKELNIKKLKIKMKMWKISYSSFHHKKYSCLVLKTVLHKNKSVLTSTSKSMSLKIKTFFFLIVCLQELFPIYILIFTFIWIFTQQLHSTLAIKSSSYIKKKLNWDIQYAANIKKIQGYNVKT